MDLENGAMTSPVDKSYGFGNMVMSGRWCCEYFLGRRVEGEERVGILKIACE
jgi:hypothetical protein